MIRFREGHTYSFHRVERIDELSIAMSTTLHREGSLLTWRDGTNLWNCDVWKRENITPHVMNFLCKELSSGLLLKIFDSCKEDNWSEIHIVTNKNQLLDFSLAWHHFWKNK